MAAVIASLLLIASLIGIAVLLAIQKKRQEKQRTEALRAKAAELGWSFEELAAVDSVSGLEGFTYFEFGINKQIKNLMYHEDNNSSITVFDYVYTSSANTKYATTYFQTMIRCESDEYAFPDFTARPEGTIDKLFSAVGYQDLDFDERPEFSRQYIVRGKDEEAIRDVFNDDVLSFYENNPGTFTDAVDNRLFVYGFHKRLPPSEIESFVELAGSLLSLMPAAESVEPNSPNVDPEPTEPATEELNF